MKTASRWPRQKQHPCFTGTHARFYPSQSNTYSTVGSHFSIHYGTGSLSGIIGADQVSVSISPSFFFFLLVRNIEDRTLFRVLGGKDSDLPQKEVKTRNWLLAKGGGLASCS